MFESRWLGLSDSQRRGLELAVERLQKAVAAPE
jgi:hypothetical protein